ncbi:MAG TPA: hypothetical protein VFX16_33220, partial [Pseudonocardiaceae bacterium]|nr:hypothetical protein [Pseudonocardiaceae bacterium]
MSHSVDDAKYEAGQVGLADWQRLARQLLGRIVVPGPHGERGGLATALATLYDDTTDRAQACAAISAALEPDVALRATALTGVVNAHRTQELGAGAVDWLSRECTANEIDQGDLAQLLAAVRDHGDLVHRYHRVKAAL